MNKLLNIFAVSMLISCSNGGEKVEPKSETGLLTVEITGVNSNIIYAIARTDNKLDTIGESELLNGKGEVAYKLEYPQIIYLSFDKEQSPLMVFLDRDGADVKIDFDSPNPELVVTGSVHQEKLDSYYEIEKDYFDARSQLRPLFMQAQADEVLADLLYSKEDSLFKWYKRRTLNFCYENSFVGASIIRKIYDANVNQLDSIYQNIPVDFSQSPDVVFLKERIDVLKEVSVGSVYTNLSLPDSSGTFIDIESLIKENEYVLLVFWASWSPPARRANPMLLETYNEFHQKGLEILGISFDDNADSWKSAIKEDGLTWPQVSDLKGQESEASKIYGVIALPHSVLINKYGVIEVKDLNELDLHEYLSENL